jgi:hypothetical protein
MVLATLYKFGVVSQRTRSPAPDKGAEFSLFLLVRFVNSIN